MKWLWTFGNVPELEAEGILAVSQRIVALPEGERSGPSAPHIIDVRTRAEYEGGHIAGALHASFLPPWAWPDNVAPLLARLDPGSELYVICLSAHRSIGALKWLRERGFSNVRQLKGGMQAWRAKSLPEVRGGEPGGTPGSGGGGVGGGVDDGVGGAAGGGGECGTPEGAAAAQPQGAHER